MFDFFNRDIKVFSPVSGATVDLSKVGDPVFSERMLGDGIAVIPAEPLFGSPCDGELIMLFPTGHAYGVKTRDGVEILVHIGIDTVKTEGAGFTLLKTQGDFVKAGDAIVKVDLADLTRQGFDLITPVLVTFPHSFKKFEKTSAKAVTAGKDIILKLKL
jgi:PTS system beta-glucosides-specific IIC component